MKDPFSEPQVFPSGVRWEPTDYKPIDQTIYIEYANKYAEKTRRMQEGLDK